MTTDARSVVDAYTNAVSAGDFQRLRELVHDEASFDGTVANVAHGADAFVQGFRNLSPIITGIDVRSVAVDGETAAVMYDLVTDTPAGSVLCSEFLTITEGQISASTLIFDWRRWPEVINELRTRPPIPTA